ncbi:MAG TPA: RNA polymerase sporulation sigma factor SigH [Firmicutes bacterium]|nr:RNA polymerase sporulation sigma factor SigH [Bacillota bacterium]
MNVAFRQYSAARTDEELVEEVKEGNEQSFNVLVKRYKSLIKAVSKHYYLSGGETDDVIQEGIIGLYLAVKNYNYRTPFRPFAELCIRRNIISAVQAATRKKHSPLNTYVSLSKPYAIKGQASEYSLLEILISEKFSDPEDLIISREEIDNLKKNIDNGLSKMEKQVLALFLDRKPYQEIALYLKTNPKNVDNALQRVRRKLKKWRNIEHQ